MNLFRAAVSLAVLAAAFPAAAAKDPPKPPSFWTQEPDAQARAAAWPDAARKQGVGGRAAMACNVQPDGALKDCQLIAESPGGMGFGQALLKLVPQYRRNLADYPGPRAVVSAHWYEIDTRPDWVKQPTARDILAVFPRGALQKGRDGQAMIECVVTVHGSLNDCIAIWETPDGEGFGRAAIGLAPQFGMKPATRQGRPTPAMVRIPVNFRTSGRVDSSQLKRVAPAAMAWAEAPSYADVVAAYPAKARADKLAGRATIQCQLTREGRLKACDTHADTPKGRGFGVAAKELAKKFRIEVAEKDRGLTDKIVVHLPFVFDPAMLSPEAQVVGKPSWARLPTPEDMKAAIAPLKLAATARAQLACVVQPGGGVDACKVVGEDPAASGVGAAALALAPKFRLTTWTSEGCRPSVGRSASPCASNPSPKGKGGASRRRPSFPRERGTPTETSDRYCGVVPVGGVAVVGLGAVGEATEGAGSETIGGVLGIGAGVVEGAVVTPEDPVAPVVAVSVDAPGFRAE